jgi:hypothetical protein
VQCRITVRATDGQPEAPVHTPTPRLRHSTCGLRGGSARVGTAPRWERSARLQRPPASKKRVRGGGRARTGGAGGNLRHAVSLQPRSGRRRAGRRMRARTKFSSLTLSPAGVLPSLRLGNSALRT